jgi:hypothetical protein
VLPAVTTPGIGAAWCSFTGTTTAAGSFTCNVGFWNLASGVTIAHIHGAAPASASSTVEIPFTTTAVAGFVNGSFSTTVNGVAFSDAFIQSIRTESTYVNIHTNTYGNGELRGQLRMMNSNLGQPAGTTYAAACQADQNNAGSYIKSCIKFNGDQTVTLSSRRFSDAACGTSTWAMTSTAVLAGMGVQPTWLGVDRFKMWQNQATVVAHDSDILPAACECNGNFADDATSTFTYAQCVAAKASCPLFTPVYAVGVVNSTGLFLAPTNPTAATAWGATALGASYLPSTATCDFVTGFSTSGASSASISVTTIALAALVAAFVARQ